MDYLRWRCKFKIPQILHFFLPHFTPGFGDVLLGQLDLQIRRCSYPLTAWMFCLLLFLFKKIDGVQNFLLLFKGQAAKFLKNCLIDGPIAPLFDVLASEFLM